MDASFTAPPEVANYQRRALIVGVVFLAIFLLVSRNPERLFQGYLVGFLFWTGITVGCLGLLLLQNLAHGAWGLVIRRVLEACTRTLPLIVLLFIPLAVFGLGYLFHWVHPESLTGEAREIVEHKRGYLNVPFFLIRAAAYFLLFGVLTYFLNKWSLQQDRTADKVLAKRMTQLSGPGLVFFILAVTFASFDWVMSLDAEWYSTIFGLIFVAGWTLSAFSFVIAVMVLLVNRKPLEGAVGPAHFHDLGKLLLAFVMLWGYFTFSQFLLIWSANIPEETKWYMHRIKGVWGLVGMALIVLHFALPFVLLLSRDLKRNASRLAMVAILVLVMRVIDLLWMVVPNFYSADHPFSWVEIAIDIAAIIGFGGVWIFYFAMELRKRPLLPLNDPKMGEALEKAHSAH